MLIGQEGRDWVVGWAIGWREASQHIGWFIAISSHLLIVCECAYFYEVDMWHVRQLDHGQLMGAIGR